MLSLLRVRAVMAGEAKLWKGLISVLDTDCFIFSTWLGIVSFFSLSFSIDEHFRWTMMGLTYLDTLMYRYQA
jgi:hypothetical protein